MTYEGMGSEGYGGIQGVHRLSLMGRNVHSTLDSPLWAKKKVCMWHGRFCIRHICHETMKRASEHSLSVAMMHSVVAHINDNSFSFFMIHCVLVPKLQSI